MMLVHTIFDWLDTRALVPPIDNSTWKQILFALEQLPMDDANYGDTSLGFTVEIAGNEYFAVADGGETVQFVAQVETDDIHTPLPGSVTAVEWDTVRKEVAMKDGQRARYEVRRTARCVTMTTRAADGAMIAGDIVDRVQTRRRAEEPGTGANDARGS